MRRATNGSACRIVWAEWIHGAVSRYVSIATIAEDIQTMPKVPFVMEVMMFVMHVKGDAGAAGARRKWRWDD
jgi:hypothetical protein